jgi:hypothetical protein
VATQGTLMSEVQDDDIRVTVLIQGVAAGSAGQSVEDIAGMHVYVVTRPRGQKLDTIHVRSY